MTEERELNSDKLAKVITAYQVALKRGPNHWEIDQRPRPVIPMSEAEKVSDIALEHLGHGNDKRAFFQKLDPNLDFELATFQDLLEILAQSLQNDIEQCLDEEQNSLLSKVHLKFLETGIVNASCVNSSLDGSLLDGFIIFMNEGLYFSLRQLFTALLFEELQGELEEFRRDGTEVFNAAINLYIKPRAENVVPLPEYVGDLRASGEIASHVDSATSLLLQFVALHEFAHAWLNHHGILDAHRLAMAGKVVSNSDPAQFTRSQELEYQADEFAFRALIKRTRTIESQWAHCFAIHLFFQFLNAIEEKLASPLSALHPPPLLRSKRIVTLLKEEFPEHQNLEADLARIDALIQKWTGCRD